MEFSPVQFEALIDEITAGMQDFSSKLDQMIPAAGAAVNHWYVPPNVKDAVLWLARETVEVGRDLLDFFTDLLKGAIAPIFMFYDAWQWMDIRGSATAVSSALTAQNLVVDDSDWSGTARDAYVSTAEGQSTAAEKIGSIADKTSTHLLSCAGAGAAFMPPWPSFS